MVKGSSRPRHSPFRGLQYRSELAELIGSTVVEYDDLDQKTLKLLEHYESSGGRGADACEYMKRELGGLTRDHVANWRAYIYTVLRSFDNQEYKNMKNSEAEKKKVSMALNLSRAEVSETARPPSTSARPCRIPAGAGPVALNPAAKEFRPGVSWCDAPVGEGVAAEPPHAVHDVPLFRMDTPGREPCLGAGQASAGPPPPPPVAGGTTAQEQLQRLPGGAGGLGRADAPGTPRSAASSTRARGSPSKALVCDTGGSETAAPCAYPRVSCTDAWAMVTDTMVQKCAAGGAIAGGLGGGTSGLAAGAIAGAACGLVPALFTFGLSIPIGAALGGSAGFCGGVAAGGAAGLVGGGLVGLVGRSKADEEPRARSAPARRG